MINTSHVMVSAHRLAYSPIPILHFRQNLRNFRYLYCIGTTLIYNFLINMSWLRNATGEHAVNDLSIDSSRGHLCKTKPVELLNTCMHLTHNISIFVFAGCC